MQRYAHELSGGMRQRVGLAMALILNPPLIIMDEPTSALDVLTQANIMNTLKRVKHEQNTAFIFITHDIATASELADRVAIMYAGQIVEISNAENFFTTPLHPYSQALIASVPKLRSEQEPQGISGAPPNLLNPLPGCSFAPRCNQRLDKCNNQPPPSFDQGKNCQVKCWLYQ
jgi:oligopeptide/dipeptide ABC transporter ATP-binding protein